MSAISPAFLVVPEVAPSPFPVAGAQLRGSYSASSAATNTESEPWSGTFTAASAAVAGAAVAATRRRPRGTRAPRSQLRATVVAEAARPQQLVQIADGLCAREDIRNIAIIAHVDHGKTTLTDQLMKQTGRVATASMDSNMIEKERGITILAKNAAITYNGIKINLIDTPGHADFGGEVERILNMADACLLLVDAQEGPMPQTKFVLKHALDLKKRIIVVINKVDKPAARPDWVLDSTFDLFTQLGADDATCDFPVVYASGVNGVASIEGPDKLAPDLKPLLDTILKECPLPTVNTKQPLQMLVTNLDYDEHMGRIIIGRLRSGNVSQGMNFGLKYGESGELRKGQVKYLWEFQHNERTAIEAVSGGDICAFAGNGCETVRIGDTVVDLEQPLPLPPIIVEEPTVALEFMVNQSPLAGENKLTAVNSTTNKIKARLEKECLTNLALRLEPGATADSFVVKGRGTLQLGILLENMRREMFELMIGPPRVITRKNPETGAMEEPFEETVVEVPEDMQGVVMEEFSKKNGELMSMDATHVQGQMILKFNIPTRGMIGMVGRILSRTRGSGVVSSQFSHWDTYNQAAMKNRDSGSIIQAGQTGKATLYTMDKFRTKGKFIVEPGETVIPGMILGINNSDQNLELNIAKEKALNNIRSATADDGIQPLPPKMRMSVDEFLGFMDYDELLEVTPGPIRLMKKKLTKTY